ncbi:MAG TPA: amidohydrolase family protein [Allosphingosinicella sp.]|nr:amidohydrolase family protein [Allosphingosinicella sp.]
MLRPRRDPRERPRPALPDLLLVLALLGAPAAAPARPPIIDMHLHARRASYDGSGAPAICAPPPAMPHWDNQRPLDSGLGEPACADPLPPARTADQILRETIGIMERRNIIAMVSGEPADVAAWRAAAPERVIAGLDLRISPRPAGSPLPARSPDEVGALHSAGAFEVLGEVMAQYEGIAPADPRLEAYWALAEARGIPVGIHLGPGGPGTPYGGGPRYRARDSSALGLEEVLVRHPRLRVYVMHAGYPLIDDLLALLYAHPQVYVDVSALVATEPRPAFYLYLRRIVEAGFGERVMFGTDQGIWPELIEAAIRSIEQAPFLSEAQRRAIFYDNAARFLRFTPEQIARHHAM